jgi:hypothetical protein
VDAVDLADVNAGASFTSTHGSAMMYVTESPRYRNARATFPHSGPRGFFLHGVRVGGPRKLTQAWNLDSQSAIGPTRDGRSRAPACALTPRTGLGSRGAHEDAETPGRNERTIKVR